MPGVRIEAAHPGKTRIFAIVVGAVADEGVVKSWSWVSSPRRQQPLGHPFAYALVLLDGSDTPFIHVVDAIDEARMKTGMRVKARWAKETTGMMTDFAFVPA